MVTEFLFTFKTVSSEEHFLLTSDEGVELFVVEFLSLFQGFDLPTMKVEALQQNTPELQSRITSYFKKLTGQQPTAKAIESYFRHLPLEEPFILLPDIKLDQIQKLYCHDLLKSIKEGKDFNEIHNNSIELFGTLLKNYKLFVYGRKRLLIGNKSKENRKCRFCSRSMPSVTFKNRAHAISEALGNKTVFLLDECDQCNERFSKTIEKDIVEYFSFLRTFYGIKGKDGFKTYAGKNFTLKNKGELTISLTSTYEHENNTSPGSYSFEGKSKYCPQDIYKMFCKFFVSIIPEEYLEDLTQTVNWINSDAKIEQLPPISILYTEKGFSKQPEIALYVRQNDDTSLPFIVGDFKFATFKHIIILPLCQRDERTFLEKADFDNFWKTFKHFNKAEGWSFQDFSNSDSNIYTITLRVEKKVNPAP